LPQASLFLVWFVDVDHALDFDPAVPIFVSILHAKSHEISYKTPKRSTLIIAISVKQISKWKEPQAELMRDFVCSVPVE
jgi:hypothetical protein